MSYVTAREVAPEMAIRVRRLADEIKKLIEDNFLEHPNEETHQKLRAARKELEDMGFGVGYVFELDVQEMRLAAHVTVYVLKEPKAKA